MDAILRAAAGLSPRVVGGAQRRSKDHPPVVHRLKRRHFQGSETGYTSGNFPYAAYELLRANNPVFSSLFAFKDAAAECAHSGRADFTPPRARPLTETIRAWSTIEDSSTSAFDPAIFSPLSSLLRRTGKFSGK